MQMCSSLSNEPLSSRSAHQEEISPVMKEKRGRTVPNEPTLISFDPKLTQRSVDDKDSDSRLDRCFVSLCMSSNRIEGMVCDFLESNLCYSARNISDFSGRNRDQQEPFLLKTYDLDQRRSPVADARRREMEEIRQERSALEKKRELLSELLKCQYQEQSAAAHRVNECNGIDDDERLARELLGNYRRLRDEVDAVTRQLTAMAEANETMIEAMISELQRSKANRKAQTEAIRINLQQLCERFDVAAESLQHLI
eukprot:TRINITY_DN2514_c0_g1_i1.p1 TRINITY_DN2514_c0_g1~~TRINITY_DN2514_c0_g1_i1.p1  ORF type:complete len:254 (-),score=52.44 TRINITY_DN2514_c0_g1_i1:154-915(-)